MARYQSSIFSRWGCFQRTEAKWPRDLVCQPARGPAFLILYVLFSSLGGIASMRILLVCLDLEDRVGAVLCRVWTWVIDLLAARGRGARGESGRDASELVEVRVCIAVQF